MYLYFKDLGKIDLFGFERLVLKEGNIETPLTHEESGGWCDSYDGLIYTEEQIGNAKVVDIQAIGYCNIKVTIQF